MKKSDFAPKIFPCQRKTIFNALFQHLRVVFIALFLLQVGFVTINSNVAYAASPTKSAASKNKKSNKSKTTQTTQSSGSNEKYPIKHRVKEGETLGRIALQYESSVHDIKEWNDLDGYRVEPNTEIIVKKKPSAKNVQSGRKTITIYHKIRPGDTFARIAKKYRVSLKSLRAWNRRTDPRKLQLGKTVRVSKPTSVKTSSSWGKANKGRLYNGVPLKSSEVIRARSRTLGYGTERTITLIEGAAADVREFFPLSPTLLVGDISRQNGGRLRPHLSHQSGRDADITYFHKGDVELARLEEMTEETFDVVKTWRLFKSWIDAKKVTYIFVDYRLQKVLYDYLRYEGYSDEELAHIIEYPRRKGWSQYHPIIRHSKGHLNHFHVRMNCGPLDIRCS